MSRTVFSVGHSNHDVGRFLGLLKGQGITAIADVRSVPYSRRMPHFSKAALHAHLKTADVAYVFLGDQLGARPKDPACYREGLVDYDLIAATEAFRTGLARVERGSERYRLALLCAEREPLDCHRTLMVSRRLQDRGNEILHLLADGSVEPHGETEERLLQRAGMDPADLFADRAERLAEAYECCNPAAALAGARGSQR